MSNRQSRRRDASRTVAALLNGAAPQDESREQAALEARQQARQLWGFKRVAALMDANARAEAAWQLLLAPYEGWDEEDIPDLSPPPEQAEADAILAELNEAVEYDRWPRHLHWSL